MFLIVSLHKLTMTNNKRHVKYLCTIILTTIYYNLQLCFMNYNYSFMSPKCLIEVKNVLVLQQILPTFIEGSRCSHTLILTTYVT